MTMDVARIRICLWFDVEEEIQMRLRYGFFGVNEVLVYKGWFELEKRSKRLES